MITTLTSSGECNSCSSSLCSCVQYPFTSADPSGRAVKGVDLRPLASWDCCFESHLEHGCLSLASVVCCYVEDPESGWSLVQRSPTLCGVPECDGDASIMRRPWPSRDCCAMGKIFSHFFLLRPSCVLSTLSLNTLSLCSFPMWETKFKTRYNRISIILYILLFIFLEDKWEKERSGPNNKKLSPNWICS
jgi:hypothetical protein